MVDVANGAKITNSSTPVRANRNGETIVCNQYIGQGVETSEAIKKLDEKLDQLIKLLQPPAFPGEMCSTTISNFHGFISKCIYFQCTEPRRRRQRERQKAIVLWTRASHLIGTFLRRPLP